MNMRLIGCTSVDELNPSLVDARGLMQHGHIQTVPADTLGLSAYDPLVGPKEMSRSPQMAETKPLKSKL